MSPQRQLLTEAARPRRTWLAASAFSIAVGFGCVSVAPEDDGVFETAHLRITNTTNNPICAGTPSFLESETQRIAAALELPLWSEDDKLDVRFGEEAVEDVCAPLLDEETDRANGCAIRRDGELVVAAIEMAYVAPHELVHAVRRHSLPRSPAMFEEGLAELLSGSEGFPIYVRYPHGDPVVGPLELLEISRGDFSSYYVSSMSFVSWLWETEGRSSLMAFVNDPMLPETDATIPLFEQHFGLPLADAEQEWRVDERPDPIWGAPCTPDLTYSLADGPVELSGDLDCDEPTVYGASHVMALWPMCLEVPETTRVRISVDADHGRFQILGREPCDAGPASAEAYRDKYMEAGDVLEADIAGCRYRMLFSSQEAGFPPTPYTIRVEEIAG